MKILVPLVVAAILASMCAGAWAEGDAARGARAFQQCASCHSMQPDRHLTGPSLAHVFGRKAATVPGFERYSDALRQSGIVWRAETLDRWIANPQAMVPGTAMTFAGIRNASARADLVAYLKAAAEGNTIAAGQRGGGMMGGMMGAAEPEDLRRAGPDSQVTSIGHCRDTYLVGTRDGKSRRIWEYNLRLKTDSSDRGPAAGAPILIGSGMRGDRFSIVFAAPSEISHAIQERCER